MLFVALLPLIQILMPSWTQADDDGISLWGWPYESFGQYMGDDDSKEDASKGYFNSYYINPYSGSNFNSYGQILPQSNPDLNPTNPYSQFNGQYVNPLVFHGIRHEDDSNEDRGIYNWNRYFNLENLQSHDDSSENYEYGKLGWNMPRLKVDSDSKEVDGDLLSLLGKGFDGVDSSEEAILGGTNGVFKLPGSHGYGDRKDSSGGGTSAGEFGGRDGQDVHSDGQDVGSDGQDVGSDGQDVGSNGRSSGYLIPWWPNVSPSSAKSTYYPAASKIPGTTRKQTTIAVTKQQSTITTNTKKPPPKTTSRKAITTASTKRLTTASSPSRKPTTTTTTMKRTTATSHKPSTISSTKVSSTAITRKMPTTTKTTAKPTTTTTTKKPSTAATTTTRTASTTRKSATSSSTTATSTPSTAATTRKSSTVTTTIKKPTTAKITAKPIPTPTTKKSTTTRTTSKPIYTTTPSPKSTATTRKPTTTTTTKPTAPTTRASTTTTTTPKPTSTPITKKPTTTTTTKSTATTTRTSTTTTTTPKPTSTATTKKPTTTTTTTTTTTLQPSTTPKPVLPEICSGSDIIDGVGYKQHWSDCSKFVQCVVTPDGSTVVFLRSCTNGTLWDQGSQSCTHAHLVDCPYDQCKIPGLERYPSATNCRSYWICQDEKSKTACCPSGHSYDSIKGCIPDPHCLEDCNNGPIIQNVCDRRAVQDKPLMFEQYDHGQGWTLVSCAPGTVYNEITCHCSGRDGGTSPEIECQPELYIPFNGDIKDESGNNNYLQVDGVKVVDGTGYFDGKSLIRVPRFSNLDFGDTVIIKLRYKEDGGGKVGANSLPQALVANGDCNYPSSLYLVTDHGQLDVGLRSHNGRSANVSLPSNGTGWKEAVLMVDKKVLLGSLNGISHKTLFTGSIEPSKCALQIGRGTEFAHFHGYMDDITVYLCKPKGF